MKLYKILLPSGSALMGNGSWHRNGKWMPPINGKLVACKNGYHLCRVEDIIHWLQYGTVLWEAKVEGVLVQKESKVIVRQARLVKKIATYNNKNLRLWSADCAEHVLHLFEDKYPDDKRPRKAIQAARDFANGKIDSSIVASYAASAASYNVSADDAYAAAYAATYYAANNTTNAAAAASAASYAAYYTADKAAVNANAAADTAAYAASYSEREWQIAKLREHLQI